MKKLFAVGCVAIIITAAALGLLYLRSNDRNQSLHYEREETELAISNIPRAQFTLFKAGKDLQDAVAMSSIAGERIWLSKGNYFLKVDQDACTFFYPLPLVSYRGGPDKDGTFNVTIRLPSTESPHAVLPDLPDYVFIPARSASGLRKVFGRGTWIFGLPTEAEWEKVARGPDNFDYGLGMNISDREVSLYNWKKNPGAEITVVGVSETKSRYAANRYGVYHMTGTWRNGRSQSTALSIVSTHMLLTTIVITMRWRANVYCAVVRGTRRALLCSTFPIVRIFALKSTRLIWDSELSPARCRKI